jgi:sulfatase modifying factor 1
MNHSSNTSTSRWRLALVALLLGVVVGLVATVQMFVPKPLPRAKPAEAAKDRPDGQSTTKAPTEIVKSPWDDSTFQHLNPAVAEPTIAEMNSLGMKFALIPAGEFEMGSSEEQLTIARSELESSFAEGETPVHTVSISKPFLISIYEVTCADFEAFVAATGYVTEAETDQSWKGGSGWDPSKMKFAFRDRRFDWRKVGYPQSRRHPVVNVTHRDCVAFCEWLSQKESRRYRLPTEAEWEYACRAGTTSMYYFGDDANELVSHANVADDVLRTKMPRKSWSYVPGDDGHAFTAPVGMYPPNEWGLFDMHGNVSELCSDYFDPKYYERSPQIDPKGPDAPVDGRRTSFVVRGGSWQDTPADNRSGNRIFVSTDNRHCYVGFRVVLEVNSRPNPE